MVKSGVGSLGSYIVMAKAFLSEDHPISETYRGEVLYLLQRFRREVIYPESWLTPLPLLAK